MGGDDGRLRRDGGVPPREAQVHPGHGPLGPGPFGCLPFIRPPSSTRFACLQLPPPIHTPSTCPRGVPAILSSVHPFTPPRAHASLPPPVVFSRGAPSCLPHLSAPRLARTDPVHGLTPPHRHPSPSPGQGRRRRSRHFRLRQDRPGEQGRGRRQSHVPRHAAGTPSRQAEEGSKAAGLKVACRARGRVCDEVSAGISTLRAPSACELSCSFAPRRRVRRDTEDT